MGWTWPNSQVPPVVKKNGKCCQKSQWKYCPYWMAKHSIKNHRKILGYRCSLFNKDFSKNESLDVCNEKYGSTYEGKP